MADATKAPRVRTRGLVKRHRRERQIFVFGALIFALAAVGFLALGVYNGTLSSPVSRAIVTPPSDDFVETNGVVCPPANTKPIDAHTIVVRTQNGSGVQGLAGKLRDDLINRGFVVTGAINWKGKYEGTVRIMFGSEGIANAYTLANHFENPEMILDTREGATVDIVAGEEYGASTLRPLYAPELSNELDLSYNGQCSSADLVRKEPAPRVLPTVPDVMPSLAPDNPSGEDGILDDEAAGE